MLAQTQSFGGIENERAMNARAKLFGGVDATSSEGARSFGGRNVALTPDAASSANICGGTEQRGDYGDDTDRGKQSDEKPHMPVKKGSLDDILATRFALENGDARPPVAVESRLTKDGAPTGNRPVSVGDTDAMPVERTPSRLTEDSGAKDRGQARHNEGGSTTGVGMVGGVNPCIGVQKNRGSLDDILGTKLANVTKGSTTTMLQDGDTVEALSAAEDGKVASFTLGVVLRVRQDGLIDVKLKGGRTLQGLSAKEVQLVRRENSPHPSSASPDSTPDKIVVGDRVQARLVLSTSLHYNTRNSCVRIAFGRRCKMASALTTQVDSMLWCAISIPRESLKISTPIGVPR